MNNHPLTTRVWFSLRLPDMKKVLAWIWDCGTVDWIGGLEIKQMIINSKYQTLQSCPPESCKWKCQRIEVDWPFSIHSFDLLTTITSWWSFKITSFLNRRTERSTFAVDQSFEQKYFKMHCYIHDRITGVLKRGCTTQNRWMAKAVDFRPAHPTVPYTFSFHVHSVGPFESGPLMELISQQPCNTGSRTA